MNFDPPKIPKFETEAYDTIDDIPHKTPSGTVFYIRSKKAYYVLEESGEWAKFMDTERF